MPQWFAEIKLRLVDWMPPIVLSTAAFDQQALGLVAEITVSRLVGPDEIALKQVPAGAGANERDAHLVARDDLRPGGITLDRVARRIVDANTLEGVAETYLARAVGANQVTDDEGVGGGTGSARGWSVDADTAQVLRDHVAWPDRVAGGIE